MSHIFVLKPFTTLQSTRKITLVAQCAASLELQAKRRLRRDTWNTKDTEESGHKRE